MQQPLVTQMGFAGAALCVIALAAAPLGTTAAVAQVPVPTPPHMQGAPSLPPQLELRFDRQRRVSVSGNYLAARHAGIQRDLPAAATFYQAALSRDPDNNELLTRTFLAVLSSGDIAAAVKLADRALRVDSEDRIARLVVGVDALKQKQYARARRELEKSVRGPITDLTGTLLSAWAMSGARETVPAVDLIDKLAGAEWYAIFKELHAGLILDSAGAEEEAGKRLARAYELDASALRVVQAYGSWLSREDSDKAATKVFADFDKALPRHPMILAAIADLKSGAPVAARPLLATGSRGEVVKQLQAIVGADADGIFGPVTRNAVREFQRARNLDVDGIVGPQTYEALDLPRQGGELPRLVASPQAGAAEVLYGLGSALGQRGGEDLGLIYLNLALHLEPTHPLALVALADLYESIKKPTLAIATFERVPADSPLYRSARIQRAINLDAIERADEAESELQALIKQDSSDVEAIAALGNILRAHKKFAECADAYSKGVDLIGQPTKANWLIFYFRGICYERAKDWPKAEADLKKALELFPDQPHVLNYLGYSWIDQGINLDEGMAMIKLAVEQRPDDGYIVDSLGWAYYRLGNYDEAVKQLERAIELKPEDPTINDHLGDAYWRVGRELEARFQWAHARDLKPEPDDLAVIARKLKSGLDATATDAPEQGDRVDTK